jgi:hypothetical protein
MKKVVVRNQEGKKQYEFFVTDTEIRIAEALGIPVQKYIIEKTKINLAEKEAKNERR